MCNYCKYYLPISPYEGFCEKKKHLVFLDEYCFDFKLDGGYENDD